MAVRTGLEPGRMSHVSCWHSPPPYARYRYPRISTLSDLSAKLHIVSNQALNSFLSSARCIVLESPLDGPVRPSLWWECQVPTRCRPCRSWRIPPADLRNEDSWEKAASSCLAVAPGPSTYSIIGE